MTQAQALEILKLGKNAFITGPAGSGKTHLVNSYIKYLREHDIDIGITASTGIAATHMGGMTIHSWAGIGIAAQLSPAEILALTDKPYLRKRFERVKVLIIDEVSMLHHFRLDLVNEVLKAMKKSEKPFGGVQVILCGDFFQLPPVSRPGEPETYFIYRSDAWRDGGFTVCYLSEQFRQKGDDGVLSILNEIRSGDVSDDSRELLKSRYNTRTTEFEPTRLFTHNADVDTLNQAELGKLESIASAEYRMEESGRAPLIAALKKSCLAPEVLRLKVGARVMCVKNNFEEGYVNGTLGVVTSCKKDQDPVIRTIDGRLIAIEKASWKVEEDGKTLAELIQYPLRLAWAITVHKSQGMSLDAVEVDLSKSFEPGMGYVALSRVRSLEGLTITGMNETALAVHHEVLEQDADLQRLSEEAQIMIEELAEDRPKDLAKLQADFLKRIKPSEEEKKASTFEQTLELIAEKESIDAIAKARNVTPETVVSHIERLLEDGADMDIGYLKYEISPAHWKKIDKAIKELTEGESGTDDVMLTPVKQKVGANVSFLHIRLARAIMGFAPKAK